MIDSELVTRKTLLILRDLDALKGRPEEPGRSRRQLARPGRPRYSVSMLKWGECGEVERDPARVSGVWVFKETRVPVRALFENLEDGASIDQFLEWFPGVTRRQVAAVLEHAASSLTTA